MFPSQISFNYNNKRVTENERKLYQDYFRELIQRYGVCTYYYKNNYVQGDALNVYGEDQVTGFDSAKPVMSLIDIPNESILFSKFGLQTDADFTAIISVKDWFSTFGNTVSGEPKAGDVVRVINTGWDDSDTDYLSSSYDTFLDILNKNASTVCSGYGDNNSNGIGSNTTLTICVSDGDWRRWPQMYQLTEVRYQDIGSGINFLMGHYVWLIRGKRFEYTYEPGIHPEEMRQDSTNPNDYTTKPREGVVDDNEIIAEDSDKLFDYDSSPDSNTGPYGYY